MEPLTPEQRARLEEVAGIQREAYQHELKGDLEVAFGLKREALVLEESILGPQHPYIAIALDMLAIGLYEDRQYTEAEELFRRALAIYKQTSGKASTDVASSYEWLSFVYDDQKQWRMALTFWHDALALRKKFGGSKYFEMSQSLGIYADLLKVTGRKVKARAVLKRAKALRGK